MSTQDDDLKLEPPQVQTPAPAPAFPPGPSGPPPAVQPPPAQPPPAVQPPKSDLQPGAGRPLVEGPPMSVDEPIADSSINRTAAFAGLGLLGIGLIVVVVLLLVIIFAVCGHH
jgi:hypothetical protein